MDKSQGSSQFELHNGSLQVKTRVTVELLMMEGSDVPYVGFETKGVNSRENLDTVLFDVLDETLKQIFKDAGAKVIYDFFEKNASLKREEIIEKPKVFTSGLERLLGSAAPVIEKQIMRNLHGKFQLEYVDKEEFEFSLSLQDLRRRVHIAKGTNRNSKRRKKTHDAGEEASRTSRNSPSPLASGETRE
jgi:hypothetical protein